MKGFSSYAIEAARGIANYCSTRFPTDTPPSAMLDVPWFSEKVQIAIDAAAAAEKAAHAAEMDLIRQQARKDNLRAEDADRYEQWLTDLGRISGCGHVDERLPRCIEEAFEQAEAERDVAVSRLAAVRAALEQIVDTTEPDKGVILLSDDSPTHPEEWQGRTVQVYDHENFSPLGDALIKAWELTKPNVV